MAKSPKTYNVTITNTGADIPCRADQTILQAAIAAGIDYPYICASGNCGACISRPESGKLSHLPQSDTSLSPAQAKAGMVLGCRARPRSDVVIKWLGQSGS